MDAFIKKQDFNYIKRCLLDFNSTLRGCADKNIVEANKLYIQSKIYNLFKDLSQEQKYLLSIDNITDTLQIDPYIKSLDEYVYGMDKITESQIRKLFKKEKKLKIPSEEVLNSKKVYLSWIDESINKMYIAYNLKDKLIGMTCRLDFHKNKSVNICSLCNNIGDESEVTFVSSTCKTGSAKYGNYKSIGFHICLNNEKCNESITSLDKLEKLLKEVNDIR
ncbi:FBP domain-containing protein [Clostridium sp. SM-530-WT-3G]|uniref:FBP domain-containing protein n=1 Tax=Clostridium sp. SM-530-WT-3G TaxID=2725303 RepID=UPI000EE1B7CE|nr:FBP domain-containing protein [Clostridium sp. SM-530-WT-3G]NME81550.1 elongation factor G-binding protein [Clostridium sp. SM-530-WT-3G]HCW53825.1 elongation factor G-binding protein [Clostridium sp.]